MLSPTICHGLPLLLIAAFAVPARADCPTSIEELPAAGFLASATRAVTDPSGADEHPALTAELAVAGGVLADSEALTRSGTAAGKVQAHHRSGLAGCASADVVATRDVSAHLTASGAVPLFFTALSFGGVVDRDVEVPLSMRPEYLLAPASRIAGQLSISFVDFGITDEENKRLRVIAMPFTLEQALDRQVIADRVRQRHTTTIDTGMFRFVATEEGGTGRVDVFGIAADWIDVTSQMTPASGETGFVRISPLSIESHRTAGWSFTLDGGVLSLAGPVDCDQVDCDRGYYRLAMGHAWRRFSVEGRAERTAFIAADDTIAIDDRLTATATVTRPKRAATLTAFGALTRPWLGGDAGRTGGARVTASQQLGHGFLALVDGELARTYYGVRSDPAAMVPAIESGARLLVSLGWQARASR